MMRQAISEARRGTWALLAGMALLAAAAVPQTAAAAPKQSVHVSTGGVSHIRGATAQLNGTVVAPGITTSVYFNYGPTTAYGHQTKAITVPPPSPAKAVKVGEQVTGLLTGWHYRMCASFTNPAKGPETICGTKDVVFSGGGKAGNLKFVLPKGKEERLSVVYGGTLELEGSLSGNAKASHGLAMQATPFPFTDPFTTLGGTVVSSRTGTFIFKVARMLQSLEVRILTTDPRPTYSPVLTIHVTPRITLHVRSAGKVGLYRLYGTVSPARPGAPLTIQELLPQKASSKRSGPAPHSVGSTIVKKATKSLSRFSVIVSLSGTFHYRAFVRLPKGAVESGTSANVLIKAPASKGTTKHKHR